MAGRESDALRVARELEEHGTPWDSYYLAQIYTALGDEDAAFRWLEEAYARHHPYVPWVGQNRLFQPLAGDPRFLDLQRRMNLPEEALVRS